MLSFISVDILLAKAFLIFVICLVVRNNSCGNSSSSKVFLFNLNIVLVLFFAADFIILWHFLEKISVSFFFFFFNC